MKNNYFFHKALLPAFALLLLTYSSTLAAQQTLKQYLNQNICALTVGDNNVVNMQQGDTNMVTVITNKSIENVMKVSDGKLEVKSGNHIVTLTLKEPQTLSVKAMGNATVNIADMNCPRLTVNAEGNTLTNLQTITSQHVELTTLGNARINAKFLNLTDNHNNNSTQLRTIANNNSTIYIDSVEVGNAYLRGMDNAAITLHTGMVHNTLESSYSLNDNVQINISGVWSKNRIDSDYPVLSELQEMMEDVTNTPGNKLDWRFHSYMLWGFHNWGEADNSMTGLSDANAVRTTFNNFQWAFQWKLIKKEHCDLSVGIGFEWDRYKFNNNYVHLASNGDKGYFETWDAATLAANGLPFAEVDEWKTRLITRYVTMPLTYSVYFANQKAEATIGVVPGMRLDGKKTGMRYFYDDGTIEYEERIDASAYLNTFKVDVLAMVRFRGFGLYVQVPTMPINRNMNVDLYPIKFGIVM